MIPQFVLDNVFFHVTGDAMTEEVYWRECAGGGEGYIIYVPTTGDIYHSNYSPEVY
jgi:hypothetical protein